MDKICGIYKITSPIDKIYIGKSRNIIRRFSNYKSLQCKNQIKLYNSLVKYGYDNHLFEIIYECSENELNELEKYYIIKFNCVNNPMGLNLTEGGDGGGRPSEETKKKMSESMRGNTKWVGKKHSEETKEKIRNARKGSKHTAETRAKLSRCMMGNTMSLGVKLSEETKKKMSISQQNRKKITNETREKMSKAQKGHPTSNDARTKMSITRKGRPALNKGIKYSEEKKEHMRLKTIATKSSHKQFNNFSL